MKTVRKIALGVAASVAAVGLGLAAAYAHPGEGYGPHGGGYGMGMGGMGPMMRDGNSGGFGGGHMGGQMGGQMAAQLLTLEERQAFAEKMRNAKTPEERQTLAAEHRAEIEKRAQEKGITLPEGHSGPRFGPNFGGHMR